MPTRVLRVITRLNIGGPSIQAITLSERLMARGFETRLVHGQLGTGEGDMRYLLSDKVAAQHLRSLRRPVAPADDATALAQIYGILREFRPAIVHTHMAKAGTLGRMATAMYNRTCARSARARVVHTYHGHVLEGYFKKTTANIFLSIEQALARASDAIIAISPQIRTELLEDFKIGRPGQYRVIPLGFDLGALAAVNDEQRRTARAILDIPADAHVVSTVGRLVPIKQHHLFLETARRVLEKDPRALFLIAGDGELRQELESRAAALGVAHRTRFLGWRRDLATIYGASDVFLLTSRNEGTPVALIESLAAGVAGVSTDVGGVRDVLDSMGLLAGSDDAAGLAAHVLTFLENPKQRRDFGERGRREMLARYGLDRLVNDINALYDDLLTS